MDLGIAGRTAVVCASSQGLGLACATALAAEGVDVVLNGRDEARLTAAADQLRGTAAGRVNSVVGDLTTDDGRERLLAAAPAADILVTNNAGPRVGTFFDVTMDDMARAMDLHYWSPLALVRALVPGMCERGFGRVVNITSAMVTSPRPWMAPSSGARSALTSVMKGLSHEVAPHNVTINQLLPERIDSGRQLEVAKVDMGKYGITFEEARRRQVESISAKRLGRPEEFGAACAFLCSAHAGYISGTKLHLDGGSYVGLI
jgi:3-oxoacyl-[acyl-carrier protein] reductase